MTLVATAPEKLDPIDVMYALVLEDGRLWGEVACEQQLEDIEFIFGHPEVNKHFDTRPRGGSKSTDMAGVSVAWLRTIARARSHGYVLAANADQAAEIIDAATGLIERTPELDGLRCENERIVNQDTGASVSVIPASESGAWGKRDAHLLILDEFCQWPSTRGAKRVYSAIRTTVQKTPGCQLVILSSSGEPSHWSKPIFDNALTGRDGWRVSAMPGPVPWQDPVELRALENELTPSEYARLILNQWEEDEDRSISEEDWNDAKIAFRQLGGGRKVEVRTRDPKKGVRYVLTVDVGTVNDATVIVVAHKELLNPDEPNGGYRVVIDHLYRWQGTKKAPVRLRGEGGVEEKVAELSFEYSRAKVFADPSQFLGSLEGLRKLGVRAEQWDFTTTSVGDVAMALVHVFRNRLILVPGVDTLRDELLKVRLRESSAGVTRLDHDRGEHDDQAVTIGIACFQLLGRTGGMAAFKDYMDRQKARRNAEGANPDTGDPAVERGRREALRHLSKVLGRPERQQRTREAEQRRCQHRWRARSGGTAVCVFGCGATKDAA